MNNELKKYYDKYGRELAFDGHGLLTDTTYGNKYFLGADGTAIELKSPLDGSPIHIDEAGRYVSDYSNATFDINASGRIVPLVDPISYTGTAHIENGQLVSDVTGETYNIDQSGNVMTPQEVINQNRQQELINNWNQRDIDGTIDTRLDQISQTTKQPTVPLTTQDIRNILDMPQPKMPVTVIPSKPLEASVVQTEVIKPVIEANAPSIESAPVQQVQPMDMSMVSNFDLNNNGYIKMEKPGGEVEVIKNSSPLSIKEVFEQGQRNNLEPQLDDGKANAIRVFDELKVDKEEIKLVSNAEVNRDVLSRDERLSLAAVNKTNGNDAVYGNVQEGIYIDQNKGNAVLTTEQKGNRIEVQRVDEHVHETDTVGERPLEIDEVTNSNGLEKDLRIVSREEQTKMLLAARAELTTPPAVEQNQQQAVEKENIKTKRLVPPTRMMMNTNGDVDAVLITIMTSMLVALLCGVLNFIK